MRIFLIRHGESRAQIDESDYAKYGDENVPLTKWGHKQAVEAGKALRKHLNESPQEEGVKPVIMHSPFVRTQQTRDGVIEGLGGEERIDYASADANLTERSHGLGRWISNLDDLRPLANQEVDEYLEAEARGDKYHKRPPTGESVADVRERMHAFKEGRFQELVKSGVEDLVVIGHSNTNRAFLMEFMDLDSEWYQTSVGQGNADILMLEGDLEQGFEVTELHQSKLRPESLKRESEPYREDMAQGIYL